MIYELHSKLMIFNLIDEIPRHLSLIVVLTTLIEFFLPGTKSKLCKLNELFLKRSQVAVQL